MYLLDTNIVSELRRIPRADPNVLRWSRSVAQSEFYLSVASIEEIEIGILRIERRDAMQARMLRLWFEERLLPGYAGRILSVDVTVALRAASLHVPDPRPQRDALIAATALVHKMTVVTRNVSDFLATGVPVLNPFESDPKVLNA